MWRIINHAFLTPYYGALYGFHVMKPRNSVLFRTMPALVGTKSRTHVYKSAEGSPVPNFSYWSGELGSEAVCWFFCHQGVELRGADQRGHFSNHK